MVALGLPGCSVGAEYTLEMNQSVLKMARFRTLNSESRRRKSSRRVDLVQGDTVQQLVALEKTLQNDDWECLDRAYSNLSADTPSGDCPCAACDRSAGERQAFGLARMDSWVAQYLATCRPLTYHVQMQVPNGARGVESGKAKERWQDGVETDNGP
jgi:hypothetical protein